jgi:PDZ domain
MKPITAPTCTQAWLEATRHLRSRNHWRDYNLILEIATPMALPPEDKRVHDLVDSFLEKKAGKRISTVINTIFPATLYTSYGRDGVFKRYPEIWETIKKHPDIKWGTYPKGGDTQSITKGIVSRIEFVPYYSGVSGLRIQIDAAINPGNSGGAAVVDGKMIGMAFSSLSESENIGYIIPSEEIELFLRSIVNGSYSGKAALYDEWQTLESPALRSFLKVDPLLEGLVVSRPFSDDPAYPLKQWDVITKIGNTPVDDEGKIKLDEDLHVKFNYLVQKFTKDGKIPLTVIRGANQIQIQVPVAIDRPLVIPYLNGAYPSYFIYGPLVFSNATREYLGDFLKTPKAATIFAGLVEKSSPLVARMADKPSFEGERIVIVSAPFFPSKLAEGYSNPMTNVVKSINGIPIQNLDHLVQVLRDNKSDFVTFEFYGHHNEPIVLRCSDIPAATNEILTDNGIRDQGSPDALAIWNAKPKQ